MVTEALIIGGGALGGAVYAAAGFVENKRKESENFDFKKFVIPIVYGVVMGVLAVFLGPAIGGGEATNFGTAFTVGMSGSVLIKKFIGTLKG